MKKTLLHFGCCILAGLVIFTGCKKDEDIIELEKPHAFKYSSEVPNAYFNLAIKLTKETAGFTPPVAARAYGYTGVTLYQAVFNGISNYQSLEGQINGLAIGDMPAIEKNKEYQWDLVANSALADIMRGLYRNASAANLSAIDELETRYYNSLSKDAKAGVADRSKAYGEAVAAAMQVYADSDGQSECYLKNFPADYVPPVGDGRWVPTAPAFSKALQPYWGQVRPFLSTNVADTQPVGHPVFSSQTSSNFFVEASEVYVVTTHLTPEQKAIAHYWSDDPGKTGTPPGHSISILSQVLAKDNADLAVAAEAYAKVGMGVHDAFIACWKCKYTFNLMRPITYIQQYIAPGWTTLLTTPPFPEYISGHSVQSGASFQVMTDMFGTNYALTDRTHEARTDIDGSPRSFNSFFEMANEAAESRLYGGIHFRAAIKDGLVQGKKIGRNITSLKFKKP
jgi:PAP2 superfamily